MLIVERILFEGEDEDEDEGEERGTVTSVARHRNNIKIHPFLK